LREPDAPGVKGRIADLIQHIHPQGNQRGEDPVQPPADGGQRVRDDLVGERQPAVSEELAAPEGGQLTERPGCG
jgi:hypothetical protein